MNETYQISVDLLLIGRLLLALIWGILFAVCLQFTKKGKFLADERTWITVVVGVGVDLALSFGGDWWTVVGVIAFSSLGLIFRSLWNEEKTSSRGSGRTKMMWALEDVIVICRELIDLLTLLISDQTGEIPDAKIAEALSLAYQIKDRVQEGHPRKIA